ncbi:hypothetical protein IMCC3317_15120 [Kordia antarctica]|uniref:Uncharacterized protein n=1 Tax=Kordia antarctica TaxID=1218801 RepID=A0A7L4ZHG0_9FLAO|nr:hypothetical protein [Kordia antarctica]QHI36153.1 hypothetical protein IMCC3317_15120 [Kordia antarctica]
MHLKPIFTIVLFSLVVISCTPEAPSVVQESFTKQFENAQDICWFKDNDNLWEVSFYQEKFYYKTAAYNAQGKWLFISVEVTKDDVPNEFLVTLKKQFPDSFLIKIFKKHTNTENEYQFEIEDDGILYVLGFDVKNKLLVLENETYKLRNEFIIEND